jgi:hypothetical protein
LTSIDYARSHPKNHVVERMSMAERGDAAKK